MFEKGTFEKVSLKRLRKKGMFSIIGRRVIMLFDEVILLVNDRKVRENFQGFQSCPVHSLILSSRNSKEFGKYDTERGCNVPIFGNDAVVFDG